VLQKIGGYMYGVGIDIGSTAAKVAISKDLKIVSKFVLPSGWNSRDTAKEILERLENQGITKGNSKIVATGYGRISVPYADKVVTEITCHGKGATYFTEDDCTVVDIGGQDTKVISIEDGVVADFTMNDKCSAGTGRFIEVMANSLGLTIEELVDLSTKGANTEITSMCTVFAESEVISLVGSGTKKEDIAYGIVSSVVKKVKSLCTRHGRSETYFLSGGFSGNENILKKLEKELSSKVISHNEGRYTGAIGASLIANKLKKKN